MTVWNRKISELTSVTPSMICGQPLNEYFSHEEESDRVNGPTAASQKQRVAELVRVLEQALEGKPSKCTDVEILSRVRESDLRPLAITTFGFSP